MARAPVHPGEIFNKELKELNMSARDLAAVVPANRLYQIIAGKRNITADTALRLARYFRTSPEFWMNLQTKYELDLASQQIGAAIERIPQRTAERSIRRETK
jgi:addiction module HigA family antidote